MTPEQEKAMALARARRRRADAAAQPKSPEMAAGMADLSAMSRDPQAAYDKNVPPRTMGQAIYDNVIGNPKDGVQSFGESLGTWLNRAGESMTLGVVGDEASAAAYGALPGRSYNSELARFRGNEDKMSTAGRVTADLIGAIVPAFAGVGMVSSATTLPGKIFAGAKFGAGAGATQGFMEGEGGATNRLKSAGVGALVGGGIGGAIPVVSEVGKAAWRSIKDAARASRIAKDIGGRLGVSPETAKVVGNIVGSDDPNAMRQALDASGADAMLADASPALGVTADSAMRSPVAGSRAAFDRIEARAGKATDDLMGAVNPSGAKVAVGEAMDAARTGSAAARKAAYDTAYAKPIDYSSEAGSILLDKVTPRLPGKAISYANELMRLRGEKSAQIMATIAPDGSVTFTRPPDVRQWDYIKQALNQLAESGDGAGALGGQTRLGAAYASLATDIRDAVATAVPEYKTALGVAADAISERNAVKFGSELLADRTTTYDALKAIRTATPAERDAMKVGLIGQMEEVIGNIKAVPSDQNIDARQAIAAFKSLTSPNAQKKMEALFGADWPAIKAEIGKAGAALGLRARTAANSATAGRAMADRAVIEATTPSPLRSGKLVEAGKNFIGGITGASPEAVARLRDEVKGELADLLTRQGGSAQNALGVILNSLAANPVQQGVGRGLYNALALGGFTALPMATDRVRSQLLPR